MDVSEEILFTAVVRPQKAEALVKALLACDGVSYCHAIEVRGSGVQTPATASAPAVLGFLPKVLVVGSVQAPALDDLEQLIVNTCPTGHSGDGKLFLQPTQRCIDLDPHGEEL